MKNKSNDLLTMPEAGEELHCTASQVRKLVRDGVLAGEKCCFKTLRLRRSALEMLAEDGKVSFLHIRAETAARLHALATTRCETADDLADRLIMSALVSESLGDALIPPVVEPIQLRSVDAPEKKSTEKVVRKRKKSKKKKAK